MRYEFMVLLNYDLWAILIYLRQFFTTIIYKIYNIITYDVNTGIIVIYRMGKYYVVQCL